ncbi:hypothetical protein G7Y89_g6335 [Cudoniella acicularis]|uniref:PXA domain-containing protein n=1 Tax=Cudoniella acicularis TaxID=354080 RepID=A0A8H4W4V5_9HELO|nr:hypothetical protein G7Y89_g6335 [Cudoniella acicularis]
MSRLQPRSKAISTSNVSPQSAVSTVASSATGSNSAATSKDIASGPQTPVSRPGNRPSTVDPVSDRSTLFLIRRTLCSHLVDKGRSTPLPIENILPPLTSSNGVDLQLYAFIAIIIREFVHTWYTKITPDPMFVEEVVKIIAHCTRALEQRIRNVDLQSVLFDELPDLLDVHLKVHRTAHYKLHPSPLEVSPRTIYHSLWPMTCLSPVPDDDGGPLSQQQMNNEAVYRQMLVQGVLAVLLPTEDLENDCLTTLVGQIFSEMIIGGAVGGKAAEPWLLWEVITKVAEVVQNQLPRSKAKVRLERSHSDVGRMSPFDATTQMSKAGRLKWHAQKTFWLVLQYIFLAWTALRFLFNTITTASSLPPRSSARKESTKDSSHSTDHLTPNKSNIETLPIGEDLELKKPIIKMKVWSFVDSLLDLSFRMPWLSGTISMLQWAALTGFGEVGNTDGILDKILSHAIDTHVLDPSQLPSVLRNARAALFPNNAPAPPRVIPSPAEQLLIRKKCAETILSLIPAKIQDIYFGGGREKRVAEVEEVLNMFDDPYCNKHLLYGIVELLIVRLMPELAEKGVEELFEERLS